MHISCSTYVLDMYPLIRCVSEKYATDSESEPVLDVDVLILGRKYVCFWQKKVVLEKFGKYTL